MRCQGTLVICCQDVQSRSRVWLMVAVASSREHVGQSIRIGTSGPLRSTMTPGCAPPPEAGSASLLNRKTCMVVTLVVGMIRPLLVVLLATAPELGSTNVCELYVEVFHSEVMKPGRISLMA